MVKPDDEARASLHKLEKEIAERKKSEEALRESEEKFRTLVEATSDWIWETDAEGRYMYASPRVLDLLGYEPYEVVGKKPFDFMPPAEAERLSDIFAEIARECRPFFNLVNENVKKDGTHVILETSGVPKVDAHGRLLGFRGIDRDISERKKAEQTIQESRAFIQAFLDTSRDWIWAIDRDAVHTYSNPAIKAILGYEVEEIIGVSGMDLIAEEDRDRVTAEVRRAVEERRGWKSLIVRWKHRDGGYRHLESSSVPILDDAGNVLGFRGADRDVTERVQAEEARLKFERRLLQGQKLESLGVLAGGIAHDFNNLLMAILGNLEIASTALPQGSPAQQNIQSATQAVHRAHELTRQMLAYSGKGRFLVTRLDLGDLVRQNAELFKTAISRKVSLDFSPSSVRAVIEADPSQVQQIVMNLVTNASEAYGGRPGVISLATGVEECSAQRLAASWLEEKPLPGSYAYLEVSDAGAGMDEQTQARLFDPFFSTKFMGRGLGMPAVQGIVRGHKGAIIIDSAAGRGTTVRVLFPLCAGQEDATRPFPSSKTGLNSSRAATVLVADDEQAVRAVSMDFIGRLGFKAIGAADGEEALALFEAHAGEIAFVLLDLTMPKMDGVAAFHKMKIINPDVLVVLTSGYDEQEAIQRFNGEGLAGFIKKPFSMKTLNDLAAKLTGKTDWM